MNLGFVVGSLDIDPGRWHELGSFFAELEDVGADTIWLTDHVFSGHPSADPFVLAAIAATATTGCAIGTGVLQLPLRRSAAVAKAASTLALVSNGRFRLGVGVGQHAEEFHRSNVDFTRRGADADRLLAALHGHWTPRDGWFSMRPVAPPVPIWTGGSSPRALARTARVADGWLGLFLDPDGFADASLRLDAELAALGRPADRVVRHMIVMVCPTDATWSRDEAVEWAGRQFPNGTRGIGRYVITGRPDECIDALSRFTAGGATALAVQIPHPDPVPRFRSLWEAAH